MANLKNTTVDDTGSVYLPFGTSAERPSSPVDGDFRYNTELGWPEYYWKGFWVNAETNKGSVPMQGLICLLDIDNPSSYPGNGNTIFDISGGTAYNGTVSGNPSLQTTNTGSSYLAGDTSDYISIPLNVSSVTGDIYTIMTVAGYNGGSKERITAAGAGGNNWLLGHHGGLDTCYFAEGWVIDQNTSGFGASINRWGVHVGTGNTNDDQWSYFKNGGFKVESISGGSQGPTNLSINNWDNGAQRSDWKWQFLAVWDRELGGEEIVFLTSEIRKRGGF